MKKKQRNNKKINKVSDVYLMNTLIFLRSLIFRIFIVLSVILTFFKVMGYLYVDVRFFDLPNFFLFFSSFVVLNYFFLVFVRKIFGDKKGENEFMSEVQFELYEESMIGLSLFTLYWFILTNYHVLI